MQVDNWQKTAEVLFSPATTFQNWRGCSSRTTLSKRKGERRNLRREYSSNIPQFTPLPAIFVFSLSPCCWDPGWLAVVLQGRMDGGQFCSIQRPRPLLLIPLYCLGCRYIHEPLQFSLWFLLRSMIEQSHNAARSPVARRC